MTKLHIRDDDQRRPRRVPVRARTKRCSTYCAPASVSPGPRKDARRAIAGPARPARRPARAGVPRARAGGAGANRHDHRRASRGDTLHPLQQKFLEHAALQCGICTPGFIVAAKALLDTKPHPERGGGALLARRQPVPVHRIRQDHPRGARRRVRDEREPTSMTARTRVQVRRHASHPPRRRGQGDRPRELRRRRHMPGMLHGFVLRSPHAHARIVSIDTSAAEAMPGVQAVITGSGPAADDRKDRARRSGDRSTRHRRQRHRARQGPVPRSRRRRRRRDDAGHRRGGGGS